MITQAIIVSKPQIDFDELLYVLSNVLNHNPAENIDKHNLDLCTSEKFSSILAAVKNPNSKTGFYRNFLTHLYYSVMIIGLEEDIREAVELCSGMPYIFKETKRRGFALSIITGTLLEWKNAVVAGLSKDNEFGVRSIFNSIYDSFVQEGIQLWSDFDRKIADNILLLEKK